MLLLSICVTTDVETFLLGGVGTVVALDALLGGLIDGFMSFCPAVTFDQIAKKCQSNKQNINTKLVLKNV